MSDLYELAKQLRAASSEERLHRLGVIQRNDRALHTQLVKAMNDLRSAEESERDFLSIAIERTYTRREPLIQKDTSSYEFWGFHVHFVDAWMETDFQNAERREHYVAALRELFNASRDMELEVADRLGVFLLFLGSGSDHDSSAATEVLTKRCPFFQKWLRKYGLSLEIVTELATELADEQCGTVDPKEIVNEWKKDRGLTTR